MNFYHILIAKKMDEEFPNQLAAIKKNKKIGISFKVSVILVLFRGEETVIGKNKELKNSKEVKLKVLTPL